MAVKRHWLIFLLCLLYCPTLFARQLGRALSAPALGFAVDRENAKVRPIWGIPGAATVGEAAALEFSLSDAIISPLQDYALVLTGEDRHVARLDLLAPDAGLRPIEGLAPGPDQMTISPAGTSAAFYYAGARHVIVVSRLAAVPAVTADLDVAGLPSLTAFAVHDGGTVLAGFREETGGSLYALAASQSPRFIFSMEYPSAISFLRTGHDAVVTDRLSNNVYYVTDVAGVAQTALLASADNGVRAPFDVALSRDDRTVLVANADFGLTRIGLADGAVQFYSYGAQTKLQPMRGNAVFLLSNSPGESLLVFDGDADDPRLVAVPRAAAAVEQ